ncbi:MAG TPA: ABC transporter permease [Candidatus Limnocylindrales bacterium]|nr:ABC transporter permease [Candidatus Limnocylindrales bacterium]
MTATPSRKRRPSWFKRFWAIVRYEMLWNIRKKKFIGIIAAVFVIATLILVLPPVLSRSSGVAIKANPYYAITFGGTGFLFLLFAIGTSVNSISSEFESGSIVPLITKPVSRTMIFLGKLFGAFVILLVSYIVLYGYITIASVVVYGPQKDLQYMPIIVVGSMVSTLIWVSIMFAVGSISKNTIMTVIMAIILFLAFFFAAPLIGEFYGPSPTLNYFPGTGASGTIFVANGTSVGSGTDNIGVNIVNYALYSSANVTYFKTNVTALTSGNASAITTNIVAYTESTAFVAIRSLAIAAGYIASFLAVAWVALKRSQILE